MSDIAYHPKATWFDPAQQRRIVYTPIDAGVLSEQQSLEQTQ